MNIITKTFETYRTWIDGWSVPHLSFFLQAALLFGLTTLFCFISFQRGNRSVGVQVLSFVIALLSTSAIPVEKLVPQQATVKMWVFSLCFVALLFLPGILPTFLTPQLGAQQRIRKVFYIILCILFIANLFLKGGQ